MNTPTPAPKKYLLGTSVDVLLKADALTKNKDRVPRYTTALVVDGVTVLVKKTPERKTLIELPPVPHDFQFIPVGNRIPNTATTLDATADYRRGLSRTVNAETSQLEPASGPATVMHGTFGVSPAVTYATRTTTAGSASWHGSTDHVISWNGIGNMDGCQTDYRAYVQSVLTQTYIVPGYEGSYYHANDRNTAPDSGGHLKGDESYTEENPDNAPIPQHERNTSVFRDGVFAYKAAWPVLAACEVKVTEEGVENHYLRVLCGRFVSPPELMNLVQGNPDHIFEAFTLSGFYLYVQSATGWELTIIEVPVLAAHPTYPNDGYIVQAPHFSADGTVAVGIIETGLGGAVSEQFYESKLVNKTEAWVFKIDVVAGTCTLVEPASTYTFECNGTNTSDSTTYSYTRSQTLAVYPATTSTLAKIVKTEVLATSKDVSDDDKAAATITPVVRTGEAGSEQVSNIQALIMDRIGELQAEWAIQHPGVPTTGQFGEAVYPTSDNHQTGDPSAYSYIPEPADASGIVQFALDTGLITVDTAALADAWEFNSYGPSAIGICGKTSLTNPNQTVTTTKTISIDVFGTVVSTSPATLIASTGGQEVVMRGDGWIASGYGVRADHIVAIPIEIDRSWQANTVASTSSGNLDVEQLVVVAADPRKGAAIIKNMTSGALRYVGITEPSGGF